MTRPQDKTVLVVDDDEVNRAVAQGFLERLGHIATPVASAPEALERLAREGETGREKITQYTRYLTLVLCVVQGYAMAVALENAASLAMHRREPSQALLHLEPPAEDLHDPRDLGEADDLPVRDVGDVGLPDEGEHVVLAEAVDLDVADQHRKLVAPHAGDRIVVSDCIFDPVADFQQQLVTCLVAQGVVDALEVVEVYEE